MNDFETVWEKIERRDPDECWPWLGYMSGGYGRLDMFGIPGVRAHRAAYIRANPGSIDLTEKDGIFVLHTCDNPICCNPKHLYLGDHAQNMKDKKDRRRSPYYPKATGPRCKLTEEDVRNVRRMKKDGATKKALALLYEVSEATISGCCYGRHYQDID